MKKQGDSCDFAKQLLPVVIVLLITFFAGMNLIKKEKVEAPKEESSKLEVISYERRPLDIPTKIVDESGNVITSSTGFVESTSDVKISNTELNENAKKVISDVFNGTYIINMMKNSDLDDEKKNIIYGFFGEKNPELEETSGEQVSEEENIIVASINNPEEEIIEVEQVVEEPVVKPSFAGSENATSRFNGFSF